jgi:dCMP deaminase
MDISTINTHLEGRPSWNTYFMEIAHIVKKRSTCLRRQVGAVLTKENRIIATGYNSTPKWSRHCDEIGCLRQKMSVPSGESLDICNSIHAEVNAILQCSYMGMSTKECILYTTVLPCVLCARIIINSGIVKIVYDEDYPNKESINIFRNSGIETYKIIS